MRTWLGLEALGFEVLHGGRLSDCIDCKHGGDRLLEIMRKGYHELAC